MGDSVICLFALQAEDDAMQCGRFTLDIVHNSDIRRRVNSNNNKISGGGIDNNNNSQMKEHIFDYLEHSASIELHNNATNSYV